jgi:hypothetical protein
MAWTGTDKITNWAGNIEYSTDRLQTSASLEEVRDFVKKQSRMLRSKRGRTGKAIYDITGATAVGLW